MKTIDTIFGFIIIILVMWFGWFYTFRVVPAYSHAVDCYYKVLTCEEGKK